MTERESRTDQTLRALELLPALLRLPSAEFTATVLSALRQATSYMFPLSATELVPLSSRHTAYIAAVDRLLAALAQTGEPSLLPLLFPVLREREHPHAAAVATGIAHFVATAVSSGRAPALMKICAECVLFVPPSLLCWF
jgi:hypothetical protein